jgi:protein-tyrosine phosphatase
MNVQVAHVVRSGGRVLLVCYSGRGRSGTLISAAVGMLQAGESSIAY